MPMVGLCGLPPIEQKTLDGWGTRLIFDLTPKNIPQGLKPVFFCWLYRPD